VTTSPGEVSFEPLVDPVVQGLVDQINTGKYDDHLKMIIDTATARQRSARMTRSADEYFVGDRVRFNDLSGTKYLHGEYAVITSKRRTKVTVKLERPVGRFARYENGEYVSIDVVVPVSIIDKVSW
jgi:hypothetical protein